MKKVLFLIHDLGPGGAEKVLVNLVNNLNTEMFDVTVIALFGGGINEKNLKSHVHYRAVFPVSIPGNSHIMKLFSPQLLHRLIIKERFDIEVSYLEGPSARIISGCKDLSTKLVSWIHTEKDSINSVAESFRSYKEAVCCYNRFHKTIGVSQRVKDAFKKNANLQHEPIVLYNTNESESIRQMSMELSGIRREPGVINWCGVGKLVPSKGYDRLLRIQKRLIEEGYRVHFHALGIGPMQGELESWCKENGIADSVTFWGYKSNPYKYVANCDLFVCASHVEGFSTAATEALIVGTPVCTVDVSGMKEMLGENNEYGIVTTNDEEALFDAVKELIDEPDKLAFYAEKAKLRGYFFSKERTIQEEETMLLDL